MPPGILSGRRQPTGWALALSLGAHLLLVGVGLGSGLFKPTRSEPVQKPVAARLVRLGTPRDPSRLPRKPAAAPATSAPKVVPIPGAKAPDEPDKPAPQPSAGPRDKRAEDRSRLFDAFARTAARADPVEGAPDGDPDGDSSSASEGERYFGLILAKARRNYGVTKTISPAELATLKAVVILYIGSRGELLRDPELQASSGNAQFDQDVLLSLRKAAPFGPPPPKLARTLRTVGVAIEATP